MPVYNVEKYVANAIESVLNQTFQDYQIIIVNDGTTDSSLEICQEYERNNKEKIKIISKQNEGLLLARRTGLKYVEGEYVLSLDSDDQLETTALEKIYNSIQKSESDLIFFDYFSNAEDKDKKFHFPFENGEIFSEEKKKELYLFLCNSYHLNYMWNKAVKKDIIDIETDYKEFKDVNLGEDLLQTLPLLTNAKKVEFLRESLYFYRRNNSSLTRTFRESDYISIKKAVIKLHEYIKIWGLQNEHGIEDYWNLAAIYRRLFSLKSTSVFGERRKIKSFLNSLSDDSLLSESFPRYKEQRLDTVTKVVLWLLYNKKINILFLLIWIRSKLS